MGKVLDGIDGRLATWIAQQPLFFVGSAPLAAGGHVNVSPKGPIGTLRVLGPHEVAYLDVVGSGAETAAHLQENGRIVLMLCAFAGAPRIVRLHGTGEVVWAEDARFAALVERCGFEEPAVAESRRAVVRVDVTRVADACGWGVPLMEPVGVRDNATRWARGKLAKRPDALDVYKGEKNSASIDGLPAWSAAPAGPAATPPTPAAP